MYKIILADDHEMFRQGLKALLERDAKFKVVAQANHGEELLEKVKQYKPDLIIVDLSMPVLGGMQAIKEIRVKNAKTPILVLTMQKDHEHLKHAIKNGANGYLLKEEAFDQLVLAVKILLKGKNYYSPVVSTFMAESYVRSQDQAETSSIEILTKREQEILKFVAAGMANKNIASQLNLSVRTIETHRANLTKKLGLKNTAALVKYAMNHGLV